ncbi:MAG: hypothetical protein KGM98_09610, partial [Bacteroidota bacterium]|nr:hypothetical protein [Bacteroidota bacterium]
MKIRNLHSYLSVFLFLVFATSTSSISAQQIKPTIFNFKDLASRQAAESFHKEGEAEIDGGWRYLHGNMPFPKGARVMIQKKLMAPTVPAPMTPSPPPVQGFLGHLDPIDLIPPDCDGIVGQNNVVTATNEYVIVHAKNGGAVLSQVTFTKFFNNP